MFDQIFDAIEEWMRELLSGIIHSNLDRMFTDVNEKTGEIAAQVGMTPQGWNSSIFSMIETLSDTVILPIAGIIITFVLCYELITMVTEKNNMHDIDTWMFFKYFVKMWIAVYLVSHTFTITMAVFDVGQHVVSSAAGLISGSTAIDISSALTDGDPDRQLWNEDRECTYHSDPLWTNDRDLLIYFSRPDPVCHHDEPRVGADRDELFQRTFCPCVPGISDNGMRGNLFRTGCGHPVYG